MTITNVEWFLYIVRCKDNSLYSGITNNLEERVKKHNEGTGAKYTSSHKPVTLVYSERYSNSSEAKKREQEIKRWPKSRKEALVLSQPEIPRISHAPDERDTGIDDFSAELMAPCGMNCALCSHYLALIKQAGGTHRMVECPGCRSSGRQCAIKRSCERVRRGKTRLCSECAEFPCSRVMHIDERYRKHYNYSMIDTLKAIQKSGVEAVLAAQREHHRCPRCGGVICIHNGKCYTCDEVKSWRG
ncbi:MAG: GIY-YIG nuclease family protein [Dehalococcoidales bacterium]|jgi:predicted GIY-YIG superfamily endonuclease